MSSSDRLSEVFMNGTELPHGHSDGPVGDRVPETYVPSRARLSSPLSVVARYTHGLYFKKQITPLNCIVNEVE